MWNVITELEKYSNDISNQKSNHNAIQNIRGNY